MKKLSALVFFFLSLSATAQNAASYYQGINSSGNELRSQLHNLIKDHQALGYDQARSFLFGDFYLEQENSGEYFLHDVYCQKNYMSSEFPGKKNLGPGKIPDNSILNCEHTWPKSRFGGGKDPKRAAEYSSKLSDLHHLFPSDSVINAIRGNSQFSDVDVEDRQLPCDGQKFGHLITENGKQSSEEYYEPPTVHKGNVARALFYFAVRYKMTISSSEEKSLRQWHKQDPVDAQEMERNQRIFELQQNRNPFIDHPEFADLIEDF